MEISSYHAAPITNQPNSGKESSKLMRNQKGGKNVSKIVYQTQPNEVQIGTEIEHDRKTRQQKYGFLPDPTFNPENYSQSIPFRHKIAKIKVKILCSKYVDSNDLFVFLPSRSPQFQKIQTSKIKRSTAVSFLQNQKYLRRRNRSLRNLPSQTN
jgi:hypothetical protein